MSFFFYLTVSSYRYPIFILTVARPRVFLFLLDSILSYRYPIFILTVARPRVPQLLARHSYSQQWLVRLVEGGDCAGCGSGPSQTCKETRCCSPHPPVITPLPPPASSPPPLTLLHTPLTRSTATVQDERSALGSLGALGWWGGLVYTARN